MSRSTKQKQLIEFKGNSLPVVAVTLRSLDIDVLAEIASELFGDESFFEGDPALLELAQLNDAEPTDAAELADWAAVTRLFKRHGLNIIGVRGGSEVLRASAAAAGLPCFAVIERASRPTTAPEEATAADPVVPPETLLPQPAVSETVSPEHAQASPIATKIISRPLRSGQQVYARGSDLVVLAAVNAGAEVIADGSIHIYAPLRGRALAGASGSTSARIFTTRFEAELVSIAGVYRTFEAGVPGEFAGKPVQVQLLESPGQEQGAVETASTLSIAALNTN